MKLPRDSAIKSAILLDAISLLDDQVELLVSAHKIVIVVLYATSWGRRGRVVYAHAPVARGGNANINHRECEMPRPVASASAHIRLV